MDQRPATAHPVPVDAAAGASRVKGLSRQQRDRLISDGQSRTPDSIEEAAANLFTRVRALINESHPVNGGVAASDVSAQRLGYSTSSYDTDTSSSENSDRPASKPGGEASNFYHLSSSVASSSGEQIRIQIVPKHSVTSSIVRNDSPMPAHYLHSSTPTNIHKKTAGDRSPKLILGSFPGSVAVDRAGKQISGHHSQSSSSSADGNDEVTDGGIDPKKVREQVLPRRPFEPIPIVDPIFSVIYDSSSSSKNSQPQTPDLFGKPLLLHKRPQKPPVTPANTVATPEPLISIIPATPTEISSTNSTSTTHNGVNTNKSAYATSTVVAHTGASTPEESTIQKSSHIVGISTVEKSTMTDPEYDEKLENSQVHYTPLETLSRMKFSRQMPALYPLKGEVESESLPSDEVARHYTQEQADETSTYSDSGTNTSGQKYIPRTLYEEYILSEPRHDRSQGRSGRTHSQSQHRSTSRGRNEDSAEKTLLPMSTGSFTRIIIDLEEMLNQALELAGRAVTDSHTALEQRDASIRSIRSLRESVLSEADSMKGNAESFRTANNEKIRGVTMAEQRESRSANTRTRHKPNKRNAQEVSGTIKNSNMMSGSVDAPKRGRSLSAENTKTRKRSQQDRQESHEERSRIPRPSGNFTASSARSAKSQQKSEADKDERLLARDLNISAHQAQLNDIYSGRFPASIKQEPGWDWSLGRKRFCAGVSCAIVVLIGFVVGCYDGEDDVIKKHLKATTTVTSLGNILFIIGVAIPSLLFWPLSLLHGRKPYLLLSIALTIPLQIPQALSLPPHTVQHPERSMVPFTVCILVFRAISGFVLGFASMNALATLVDLFGPDTGACCRGGVVFNSQIPVEGQDQFSLVPGGEAGARTGVWLGVWAWLFFAFGGVGLFAGQLVISRSAPAWGPWIVAAIATVLVFFVWLVPEVRPPWKKQRIISRKRTGWRGKDELQRVDRGEIKMVVFGSSPYWWWEEVWAGVVLSFRMLNQLGFFVMTVYVGWVAGEIAMVFNLLVSLISKHYKFTLVDTGLAVLALSAGALLSAPVQLSSFYMRNFRHRVHHRANSTQHHYHEGQHPYRTVFLIGILLLPVSSLAFTISATGPPTHFFIPVFFASLVIFSGTLVIAECHLIIMDNFDISNLPEPLLSSGSGSTSRGGSKGGRPHGTQRPTSLVGPNDDFTTCHPAITSAFGILQFVSLIAIAGAVGWSRWIDEGVGIKNGLGIYTGISFLVTIALVAVIWRWKEVRILEVFTERHPEDGVEQASAAFMEEIRLCKVSIFQRGRFTRWSEVNGMIYRVDEEEDAWRVR